MVDGVVEHSQNFILDRQCTAHQQFDQHGSIRSITTSSSENNNESSPLVQVPRRQQDDMDIENHNRTTRDNNNLTPNTSYSSLGSTVAAAPFVPSYAAASSSSPFHDIRFQVVVWSVGQIDVCQGRVPVTFRVTLFWNEAATVPPDASKCRNRKKSRASRDASLWQMRGRQMAVKQQEIMTSSDDGLTETTVQVPPVSILNVATFDTIGAPDISLLRRDTRLWRWSCMYRATLIQDHWSVATFPHDEHDIVLKLAILAHRKPGEQWDRNVWRLNLATNQDSQGSTRVPHGLVVDQVAIPGFTYNKRRGLQFDFCTLDHGPTGMVKVSNEQVLEVKLQVMRDSSYYDRNIVPLLGLLNFVAISIVALEAQEFFERSLLTLNITFVEIGMRMTTDKHLPSVSYQIKMQKILNEYFICLLLLVLESNVVYELHRAGYGKLVTNCVDWMAAVLVFSHNAWTLYAYYMDAYRLRQHATGRPLTPRPPTRSSKFKKHQQPDGAASPSQKGRYQLPLTRSLVEL